MTWRLPAEILHLIILYYPDCSYHILIKLRAVCHDWKEVAEHSVLWLTLELSIYSPKRIQEIYYSSAEPLDFHIEFNTDIKDVAYNSLLWCSPIILLRDDEIQVVNTLLSSSAVEIPVTKPYEKSSIICTQFLSLFRKCHQTWEWYIKWGPFLIIGN